MSWNRPPPRVKQYEGLNPGAARAVVVRVVDMRNVLVIPIERVQQVRSESYRRWVSTLPCVCCGIEGYSQAAHPNQGRGLGQKASDLEVFPLCCSRPGHQGCHVLHDTLVDMTLTIRRGLERVYIAKTQAMARAAGRPELV